MNKPSIEQILKIMNNHGYRVYDTPTVDWNLNVVGIRADARIPDEFDDLLVVFHRFMGTWDETYYPVTTDPSPHYLNHPMNPEGTAILKPGQYVIAYQIGIHRRGRLGGHKALCQTGSPVSVYRDNNINNILDMHESTVQSGYFGINIHKGPRGGAWENKNNKYSAGCQVFADDRHFADFLLKCEYGRDSFGNSFTYTLLLAKDFA